MDSAFKYIASKRDFDVEKLGPLKRFRKFLSVNQHGVLRWKKKIVLLTQFRSRVLESAHDHPTAGHFAEDRTWKSITENFFSGLVHMMTPTTGRVAVRHVTSSTSHVTFSQLQLREGLLFPKNIPLPSTS